MYSTLYYSSCWLVRWENKLYSIASMGCGQVIRKLRAGEAVARRPSVPSGDLERRSRAASERNQEHARGRHPRRASPVPPHSFSFSSMPTWNALETVEMVSLDGQLRDERVDQIVDLQDARLGAVGRHGAGQQFRAARVWRRNLAHARTQLTHLLWPAVPRSPNRRRIDGTELLESSSLKWTIRVERRTHTHTHAEERTAHAAVAGSVCEDY